MTQTQSFTRTVATTLDSSGNGTVSTGPTLTNEVWTVAQASVNVTTNNTEATCRLYTGNAVSAAYFTDGTTWGSTGDSTSNFSGPVFPGQSVFAVWSGGDSGSQAVLIIQGTRTVP